MRDGMQNILDKAAEAYVLQTGRRLGVGDAFIVKYNDCGLFVNVEKNEEVGGVTFDLKIVQEVVDINKCLEEILNEINSKDDE